MMKENTEQNNLVELTPYYIDGMEQPMFTAKQIAKAAEISDASCLKTLHHQNYTKGCDAFLRGKKVCLYTVESALGVIFSKSARLEESSTRRFISEKIGQLISMGFCSMRAAHLPPAYMRGIVQVVCEVNYWDLPRVRRREADPYKGSVLRGAYLTSENLRRPEVFISREEIVKIKSLDLAIYLLSKVLGRSVDELFEQLGIPVVGQRTK